MRSATILALLALAAQDSGVWFKRSLDEALEEAVEKKKPVLKDSRIERRRLQEVPRAPQKELPQVQVNVGTFPFFPASGVE